MFSCLLRPVHSINLYRLISICHSVAALVSIWARYIYRLALEACFLELCLSCPVKVGSAECCPLSGWAYSQLVSNIGATWWMGKCTVFPHIQQFREVLSPPIGNNGRSRKYCSVLAGILTSERCATKHVMCSISSPCTTGVTPIYPNAHYCCFSM